MTKNLVLTQGISCMVDDDLYDDLNSYKWQARFDKKRKSFYAIRSTPRDCFGKRKTVMMHRSIVSVSQEMKVDHIDGNTLNNQLSNLRVCTHSQNLMNRGKTSKNTSGYKGVFRRGDKWIAQITYQQKIKYLGKYLSPVDAAKEYDKAAKRYHGKFAVLNFPD